MSAEQSAKEKSNARWSGGGGGPIGGRRTGGSDTSPGAGVRPEAREVIPHRKECGIWLCNVV